nr:MAG TPA: minor capsid protein [Caudoviricetes sp.]
MLPPSYLDAMPDAFVQLAQQVEDEILQDVARRIGKMGTLTETADWQLWRYQQTEAVRENVVKLLAKYSGKSEATIRRLLKEAATEAMEREDAIYYHYNLEPTPFEESAALNNLLNAGARQTCGTWRNLTATTANTVSGAFERTLDVAWGKVATGAFDYKTAVKQAVDSLADEMPEITYPSGHTDSLEVAARRVVLTGVNQTAGKLQEARMDEMNVEFVETSAHGGARPSHAEWQGRRFHRGGAVDYLGKHYPDFEQATGYGTGAGLCGWNCRHTFFAVFPELGDPPTWTEESLQELNARNIEYNGKLYTQYEVNQMQRARERNVRKWKKRYLAESAAGSDTTDSAVRLKAARQSLSEFAKATGGRVDSARVSVPKFGRSEASKAGWAAKTTPNDFKIYRGVGAKAKNYVVVDKSTGEEYYFVEGTRTQNAQVFAGKGGVNPLREEVAQGLSDEFGGKPEDWQHCKAKGWLDVDGETVKAEVHWFQNGSEKVKFKVKRWFYDED